MAEYPYIARDSMSTHCCVSDARPIEEVDRLLEGSPVREKAIESMTEVTDTYASLKLQKNSLNAS